MMEDRSRRNFIRTAPLAAACTLPFVSKPLFAEAAEQAPKPVPFQLFTAGTLAEAATKLQGAPGNENLFGPAAIPLTVVLTTEKAKRAKEFEFHEGRDHLLQVVEGSTFYEVGGTPQNARNTAPGEWLAPTSQDATQYTLHKGDMLVIPRGTPHKRSTEGSVTFFLISTSGK